MTERIRCSRCDGIFDNMTSFQNHTCSSKTYGGSGDLRKAKQEFHETEGGTGSN